jgi:type VI secretion system secreted protein Hcp
MAVDMFLKIPGLDGESTDHKHKGSIDILAWSWGLSQSGSFHTGGGGGAGKVNVQDISITKYVDKSSKGFLEKCTKGTHFTEANIIVRKAGDKPLEYIKIKMEKIMVTSVSTGGSGGEEKLTENVTLNFAKVAYTYTPQNDDGSGGGEMEYSFDIAANESGV